MSSFFSVTDSSEETFYPFLLLLSSFLLLCFGLILLKELKR